MRIFVVEAGAAIRDELIQLLQKYGYECSSSDDFRHISEIALSSESDLILLDINLPYQDGFQVCREIRQKSTIPIIVLTSRNNYFDELMSLNIGADEARRLLDEWLHAAAYCRIKPMVAVEKKVRRRREDVIAAVEHGIGNGRVESINSKIKVTVKMGYGFRNIDNLVALLMLRCSDVRPQLPGRPARQKKAKKGGD